MTTKSKIATDVVVVQIAGMDAEVIRIDKQIADLKERREGIAMMRAALAALVPNDVDSDEPEDSGFEIKAASVEARIAPVQMTMIAGSVTASSTTTGTGFRDAVRQVLRDHPKGLRPAEVVVELGKRGELARYSGKVKPSIRVHNELYLLRKSGAVMRRPGSKYAIKQETREALLQ